MLQFQFTKTHVISDHFVIIKSPVAWASVAAPHPMLPPSVDTWDWGQCLNSLASSLQWHWPCSYSVYWFCKRSCCCICVKSGISKFDMKFCLCSNSLLMTQSFTQDPFSPAKQDLFSPPPLEQVFEQPQPEPQLPMSNGASHAEPLAMAPPSRNGLQNGFNEFVSTKVRHLCEFFHKLHTNIFIDEITFLNDRIVSSDCSKWTIISRTIKAVYTICADLDNSKVGLRVVPGRCPCLLTSQQWRHSTSLTLVTCPDKRKQYRRA